MSMDVLLLSSLIDLRKLAKLYSFERSAENERKELKHKRMFDCMFQMSSISDILFIAVKQKLL